MSDISVSGRTLRGLAAPYYDGTPGTQFELYPQTFERYMPGAFDAAVKKSDVRLLFNHDPSYPLARTTNGTLRLSVTSKGLEVSADLNAQSMWANELSQAINRGDITGMSIGMIVEDEFWRREGRFDVREIHQAWLLDVSPVTFPAYEGTSVSVRSTGTRVRDLYDAGQDAKRILVTAFQAAQRKVAFESALATL